MSAMDIFSGLNPAQRKAASTTEGPLLVLAGAGAGKTRVIVHRIAGLVEDGTAPERILAVTFTNKAAGELKARVHATLGGGIGPYAGTFHSLCAEVLRTHAEKLSLPRHFSIFDRDDSLKTMRRALKETLGENAWLEPAVALRRISRAKGDGLTVEKFREQAARDTDEELAVVWEAYDARLRRDHALDFDDLLLETVLLLERDEVVRKAVTGRFSYIHIDEYQDTNRVQHRLAEIFAAPHSNICCVGDLDQSIYSWRGARPEHMLRFERTFPGAQLVVLEENYRSTETIVEAANAVIEKNSARLPKTSFSARGGGEPIRVASTGDETAEAAFIAAFAAKRIKEGIAPRDIAVLFRANFQSRALEEAFLGADVPHRVLGTRFFDRAEVKDVLSYLRAALNRESRADIERIANRPPRGIGKTSLEKIMSGQPELLRAAAREQFAGFGMLLNSIASKAHEAPVAETLAYITRMSGLETLFKKEGEEERLENLFELIGLAREKYAALAPLAGVEQLLSDAALATDQDELSREANAVALMTVHAAKGLEFDTVFVTGLEEGLFPHDGLGEERDEEEERRLFYVAMTRAKERLILTHAGSRSRFGKRTLAAPSSFLRDIPEIYMEREQGTQSVWRTIHM